MKKLVTLLVCLALMIPCAAYAATMHGLVSEDCTMEIGSLRMDVKAGDYVVVYASKEDDPCMVIYPEYDGALGFRNCITVRWVDEPLTEGTLGMRLQDYADKRLNEIAGGYPYPAWDVSNAQVRLCEGASRTNPLLKVNLEFLMDITVSRSELGLMHVMQKESYYVPGNDGTYVVSLIANGLGRYQRFSKYLDTICFVQQ